MNQNYANQNMGAQQGGQPQEPIKIKVEPLEFDGLLKTKMTTTVELAKTVNKLFRPVLSDYEGCIILPNQYGQLELTLWFKDKGQPINNTIKSILPANHISNNRQLTAFDKIKGMNMRNKLKTYDLTNDTKQILSEFIWTKPGQRINWDQLILEQTQQNFGNYTVYVKVIGLDLLRILRKIYGGKVDNARVEYNISIMRPVGMDMGQGSQNFLISIMQVDVKEVEKLASDIGLIPASGQIPMIR